MERDRANATIGKYVRFVLDFAPPHFQIDAEVAEIGQFACSLAPARGRTEGNGFWVWGFRRSGNRFLGLMGAGAVLPTN